MLPKMKSKQPFRKCNSVKVGLENQLDETISTLDVVSTTFFYETPKLWNNMVTPAQANAPSVDAFKHHFKS